MKQHLQVTCLGCVLDNTFSGEYLVLKAFSKTNRN